MDENIPTIILLDKPKTLILVKPFYFTFLDLLFIDSSIS